MTAGFQSARPEAVLARPILGIATAKLLLHLYAGRYYGYFVDELYYLACSRHLAWGYVDHPPLVAAGAFVSRSLFGDSLLGLRALPALAGAGEVVLAALLARELGGGRFAQILSALAVLFAPGILSIDTFFSMNAFEPLFWSGCSYLLIRILKTGDQRHWIWFGMLAGFGLQNKYSMLIWGAGVVAGLLLTTERRLLASPWLWAGGALAFLIFAPNLWWNFQNHFPFLELQANLRRSGRDVALGPFAFFGQQALAVLPLNVPVALAGVYFYFSEKGRPFRTLGWALLFTTAVILFASPRIYYLFPVFPTLLAAGAVEWEAWLAAPKWRWTRAAYAGLIAAIGIALLPLTVPVLAPPVYIRYATALGVSQPAIENHKLGPLPQLYADQFGWEEMAATVAQAYNALPAPVREHTAIFAQTYGQAGAIDQFGPKYGLPPAISGHQSYFLWGPRGYTGESMIVMGSSADALQKQFATVEKVAHVEHPYSMPYQHFDVYYCRGLRGGLAQMWPKLKQWN